MANTGRPKLELNSKELKKLCRLQCTLVEIADWFSCSEDTVERRVKEEYDTTFAEFFKKHSARGKMSLRRKQMQMALKGDRTLLIWLGKQYLGQKDRQSLEHSGEGGGSIKIEVELATEKVINAIINKSRGSRS